MGFETGSSEIMEKSEKEQKERKKRILEAIKNFAEGEAEKEKEGNE